MLFQLLLGIGNIAQTSSKLKNVVLKHQLRIPDRMPPMNIEDRIIVALDVESRARALKCVKELMPPATYFKVGSQLFTACGPDLVRDLVALGARVFLDLKFHDIPQTVANSVLEAARLKTSMINLHASGGVTMLQAAAQSLAENYSPEERPRLVAVTLLTSIGEADAREIGFSLPTADQSVRLAHMAQRAGLDGVVASPLEIAHIREACGKDFLIVTPGIRPANAELDDQVRISTPEAALRAGADYLVIGRPILEASNSRQAFLGIVESLKAISKTR
jgi:orotidine-5'-phosphate decarboxylase